MTALLLAPHNDDEALFAAYTCLRHQPFVVTCFAPHVQEGRGGPGTVERMRETEAATALLDVQGWQQLPVRDDSPDQEMLAALLRETNDIGSWDVVFAPAVELGGHDQHNMVGALAEEIFGEERLVSYMTYVRGSGRSRSANEVPYETDWPARKFAAMAAYRSQINLDNCRNWFSDWDREWYE